MTFLQLVLGYVIGRVLVSLLFIPAYFRGELITSYELLQRRFGPRVKNLSAFIFLITRSLADGIRLFATALVISVVTDVPVTLAVVVIGAAMIVYTVRGGASAVIWTDVVQLFVYIAGAGGRVLLAAGADSGRLDRGRARRDRGRQVPHLRSGSLTVAAVHVVGRHHRRRRADPLDARHRSVSRPAPAVGAIARARRRAGWS